jgi:hypothetical protein
MSLADLLFNDVEIASQKGVRSVLLARNESANKVKRYLLRNKRKIGLKMVGASIIAVLAPPVLLAYIGGAVAGYGASRAIKWVAIHNARERIDNAGGLAQTKMIGGQYDYASAHPATFVATSGFSGSGSLFQDLATIVRRQKLTDIFNAFSELEKDHLHLSADVELMKSRNGVDNCEHAIRLWEGHFRYHARYLDLKKDFEELDAAVMLAVLNLSRLDDEFKTKFSNLLSTSSAGLDRAQAEALLQEAANHGTVFGHWHERGRTLDRTAQIRAALQGATEARADLTAPLKAASATLGKYVAVAGLGAGSGAALSAVGVALGHAAKTLSVGPVALAAGAASASVGGIVGGAETLVLGPVIEGLNRAHNARQYATDQHGLLLKRLETKRERIGKIRPLAKDCIEKWAEKLVHLTTHHAAMTTKYVNPAGIFSAHAKRLDAAVDYLRWMKLRAQVQEQQRHVGQFQALVVDFSIEMDQFEQTHLGSIEKAIKDYVEKKHPHGHCTLAGFGLCYGQLDRELLRLGVLLGGEDQRDINAVVTNNKDSLSRTPTCPLRPHGAGKYVYEQYLERYFLT